MWVFLTCNVSPSPSRSFAVTRSNEASARRLHSYAQVAAIVFLCFGLYDGVFQREVGVNTCHDSAFLTSEYNVRAIENCLRFDEGNRTPHRRKKIIRQWTAEDGIHVTFHTDEGILQTHHLVAMSSLSRRACYKCGNVGHYAEVCSSAERLCYNCELL